MKTLILILILLPVMILSCENTFTDYYSGISPETKEKNITGYNIQGEWQAISIDTNPVTEYYILNLQDNYWILTLDVNTYSGDLLYTGTYISFILKARTKACCDSEQGKQIVKGLESAESYTIDHKILTVKGNKVLTFKKLNI